MSDNINDSYRDYFDSNDTNNRSKAFEEPVFLFRFVFSVAKTSDPRGSLL